jgi:hypothetical protein
MNLLESVGFSRSNPYYVVQQGKVSVHADGTMVWCLVFKIVMSINFEVITKLAHFLLLSR